MWYKKTQRKCFFCPPPSPHPTCCVCPWGQQGDFCLDLETATRRPRDCTLSQVHGRILKASEMHHVFLKISPSFSSSKWSFALFQHFMIMLQYFKQRKLVLLRGNPRMLHKIDDSRPLGNDRSSFSRLRPLPALGALDPVGSWTPPNAGIKIPERRGESFQLQTISPFLRHTFQVYKEFR